MILTTKQLRAFDFIAKFMHENRRAPVLREIQEGLRLNNIHGAYQYVQTLVDRGYLHKQASVRQSIRIIKYPEGSTYPTTGNTKLDVYANKREQLAYARGVNAGRASAFSNPEASNAYALQVAYKRGYRAGRDAQPQTLVEAFEKGIAFGKREFKKELTMQARDAEL
jgi:SOS-response transcriptional repressor LexA